jgi:DNA-binding MarR family transcriptional regulator
MSGKIGAMGLIAVTHLIWKRYLQRRLTPHGISLKQYYLLDELRRHGDLHPMQIAEMLYCDRPTASVVIRNLVKKGWAEREMDPDNARHVLVRLAPEGRKKLKQIGPPGKALAAAEDPLACFSESEIGALTRLLGRLHGHLRDITKEQENGLRAHGARESQRS